MKEKSDRKENGDRVCERNMRIKQAYLFVEIQNDISFRLVAGVGICLS